MAVHQVAGALGDWNVTLSAATPTDVADAVRYFGHMAILPGRVDPAQYGDRLLGMARYVGVVRSRSIQKDDRRSNAVERSISVGGAGMTFWLGDEDNKGAVLENTVTAASGSFANAVRAVLPDSVQEGVLHSVAGVANYNFQWKSPREALTALCDIFGTPSAPVEYRVNHDGTVDAGYVSDLYDTTPTCVITARNPGYDLDFIGLPGAFSADQDVEDYSTRVVALSQGEGDAITTGSADLSDVGATNPYLDLFGNPVTLTRLIDAADAENANLDNLAAQQLGRFQSIRRAITLSAEEYDLAGDITAGDFVWVYHPDLDLIDLNEEIYFRGERINPIKLRVLETTWPIEQGMTVAYRAKDGTWTDLTDYVEFEVNRTGGQEGGVTSLVVSGYDRPLTGGVTTPVGDRVNGDTSTPGIPVFGPFFGNTYQANGDETKAQIQVTWAQPLNTDGSAIVDGSHYEIRYRPNITAPYAATWTEAGQDTWNELHTWNQPRVAPITSTDWQTITVPFDQNSQVVQELTPSVVYEFQIRAVDTASPPNRSTWSSTQAFTAPRDTMPPSTPAAPLVAGSPIALQVRHDLGVSAGGTFNLEADTNHLEVHVSNDSVYLPDETTLVGRLVCAAALQSGIPVIGTFPVTETDERFVKVVAVDRSGNKSPASDAASATALLIDDAHISDLSVSKVTAGEITADWVLAASIKTATAGQRVELNAVGLQSYGEEGDQTINLSADPDETGNYITFTKAGVAVASIDEDGNLSGQNVAVNGDLTVAGTNVMDLINSLPKGLLFRGERSADSDTTSGSTEIAVLELDTTLVSGRMYRISTSTMRLSGTVIGDTAAIRVRDGGAGSPSTSSDQLAMHTAGITNTSGGGVTVGPFNLIISCDDSSPKTFTNYHSGEHHYLLTLARLTGTGTLSLTTNSATVNAIQLSVEDLGPLIDDTGVDQSAGGGGTVPVQTYTKSYQATWSGSYDSGNAYISYWGNSANQGDAPPASYGNQRGLIGFNSASMVSDLAGATIKNVTVTLYANHWYYNAGGTARIGTHNYTSRPTTWADARVNQNRWTSTKWPKPGKRTVTLPTSVGDEFKTGTSTGISVGPGTSSYTDYGRFAGAGSGSNTPVITITFTK
ncbi:fibronectin type III domain-containing protein [Streptomyces sp. MMBL 11-1]|uniref:fibronectin type III domain-containing protein n=1 Tax=Streptomyces sp. MMBL 11-1 TaxID=3026420 RepID=UPI00236074EF|nr:fibronectin type III domain-containing protein [Streptomyces sp. MMBL 11-1]